MSKESIFMNSHHHDPKVELPIRFSMDAMQIEELPVPDEDWYRFQLEDLAVPSFCTCQKDYFGNPDQIKTFMGKRPELELKLTPCKPVALSSIVFSRTAWEHRNVREFDYHMEAERIIVSQVLLDCGAWYALCISPIFQGLRYYDNICLEWIPVPNQIWGQPHVVDKSGDYFISHLYLLQGAFHDLEEAKKYMENPANIRFDSVCDEIFGDG